MREKEAAYQEVSIGLEGTVIEGCKNFHFKVMEIFVIMESHGKVMENDKNLKSHGK